MGLAEAGAATSRPQGGLAQPAEGEEDEGEWSCGVVVMVVMVAVVRMGRRRRGQERGLGTLQARSFVVVVLASRRTSSISMGLMGLEPCGAALAAGSVSSISMTCAEVGPPSYCSSSSGDVVAAG